MVELDTGLEVVGAALEVEGTELVVGADEKLGVVELDAVDAEEDDDDTEGDGEDVGTDEEVETAELEEIRLEVVGVMGVESTELELVEAVIGPTETVLSVDGIDKVVTGLLEVGLTLELILAVELDETLCVDVGAS